jgi:hypothetical protein
MWRREINSELTKPGRIGELAQSWTWPYHGDLLPCLCGDVWMMGSTRRVDVKAKVGDWLVIKGTTTERHDQRGYHRGPLEDGSRPMWCAGSPPTTRRRLFLARTPSW